MAKLTDRQRDNILAKWNTGQYSKSELARKYKVSEKTIRNIINGQPPKYKELVEVNTAIEMLKKSEISPSERQAIDIEVKKKVDTTQIDNELIENNRKIAKLLQKKIVENKDEITLNNIRQVAGTIKDIENIANPKSNDVKVENNIQNNQITKIEVEFIE
jgi:DNA-binding XRE family transcriptional regulator